MGKHIAVYVRVSSKQQSHASQLPDLQRWVESQSGVEVKWYMDKFTGKTQDRPGWRELEKDLRAGKVSRLVCHKIDRLGRTARELLALAAELRQRKVDFVVVAAGIMGLDTPEARLLFGIVAQFAEYDNEVRSERILAGQSQARLAGKTWGGSKAGVRKKVTPEKALAVRELHAKSTPITQISRAVGLSRVTVYSVLRETT